MPRHPFDVLRDKVEASHIKDDTSGCWVWQQHLNAGGYGTVKVRTKRIRAHRAAYIAWRGPIPRGLVIDHLCRNRACVNPDHLEPVTFAENVRRGAAFRAAQKVGA